MPASKYHFDAPPLAPRLPPPRPGPRQPLGHELIAQTRAIASHNAQLAAILILVAVDRVELERAGVEQLLHPIGRLRGEPAFKGAAAFNLGRVDVGDAD